MKSHFTEKIFANEPASNVDNPNNREFNTPCALYTILQKYNLEKLMHFHFEYTHSKSISFS